MFTELSYQDLNINAIDEIRNGWFLITAGNKENFNTMTANWGTIGHLWHESVAIVFVRPQRYTYKFTEENDYMTLTFFPREYHEALTILGTKSGRDCDKVAESKLTPIEVDGTVTFEEASYVLVCKKLYYEDIKKENFLDQIPLTRNYPQEDFHRMYIVKIEKILKHE